MPHINDFRPKINIKPKPVDGTQVAMSYSHQSLVNFGCNILSEVSSASSLVEKQETISSKSVSLMGHLDTGATKTTIASSLAEYLELTPIGYSNTRTASGLQETPDYTVNLSFIGTNMRKISNLQVNSCKLSFDLAEAQKNPHNPRNLGLLIGRDIMSLWNITWHGPTSTVFISG